MELRSCQISDLSIKERQTITCIPDASTDINFGTEVDTLMKTIQAKSQSVSPQTSSIISQIRPVVGTFFTPPYSKFVPEVGTRSVDESKFKLKLTRGGV